MAKRKGRETPLILCQDATGFLFAARRICDDNLTPERYCLLTFYFLIGHSIELSIKAILLQDGLKISALRSREFGHNLEALVNELIRRDIVEHPSPVDIAMIKMLSRDYHGRLYNYRQGGRQYSLPLPNMIMETAKRLLDHASAFCEVLIEIDPTK